MARSIHMTAVALAATFALAMPALAAQANATKGKAMSVSGTLEKVEGQTLTVQTQKGAETIMLAPGAQIRSAGKTVALAELSAHNGSRITVRYTERNGQKMAQSVTLAAAAKASASVAKK